MTDCIFCQIAAGESQADIVHQDEDIVAFRDINPNAPVHLLVVPREHHPNLDSLSDDALITKLVAVAKRLGETESGDRGFRLLVNSAKQADVNHVHFHVLGGLAPGEAIDMGGDAA